MNLVEALRTGLPLTRPNHTFGGRHDHTCSTAYTGMFDPDYFLSIVELCKEDILAEDWEVQKPQIPATADDLRMALIPELKRMELGSIELGQIVDNVITTLTKKVK